MICSFSPSMRGNTRGSCSYFSPRGGKKQRGVVAISPSPPKGEGLGVRFGLKLRRW
ncbi:MAG: hypothetical protein LBQ59_02420 [Candidatus Peribacteria bacterium]|nr:hypothetical protein [Candidatus Peribacteria bacterium]